MNIEFRLTAIDRKDKTGYNVSVMEDICLNVVLIMWPSQSYKGCICFPSVLTFLHRNVYSHKGDRQQRRSLQGQD